MKLSHTFLAAILLASATIRAQVAPAAATASARGGLPVTGVLHFDLRYFETGQFGGGQGNRLSSFISGDANYANTAKRYPFSMQYGGGFGQNGTGQSSGGEIFQHLQISQGVIGRTWGLTAGENVSYSFETPTVGFSGVPGSGDLGGSGSASSSSQTVLATNYRVLNNGSTVESTRRLGGSWTMSAGGSWQQLRFVDGNGQDSNMQMANAGTSRRLNGRNSISAQYMFSSVSFSGTSYLMQTNAAMFSVSRQWTRHLTTTAGGGPLWISSSGVPGAGIAATPNTVMTNVSASAGYQMRRASAGLSYFRGVNSGAGYMLGAKSDTVGVSSSWGIGKNLSAGATGSYMRTTALVAADLFRICYDAVTKKYYYCTVSLGYTPVTNAEYGGVQASRKLGRYFNAFASYTVMHQSGNLQVNLQISGDGTTISNSANVNILSGVSQVIGFGISYSPREIHLRK